jgi:hypothetical protein
MPLAPRSVHVPIVYLVGVEVDEGPIAREDRSARERLAAGVKSGIRRKNEGSFVD